MLFFPVSIVRNTADFVKQGFVMTGFHYIEFLQVVNLRYF